MRSRLISSLSDNPASMPEEGRRFMSVGYLSRHHNCAVCGKELSSSDFPKVDAYNNAVCANHVPSTCVICSRFITGNKVYLPGYGDACFECGMPRNYKTLESVRVAVSKFYADKRLLIPGYRLALLTASKMTEKYAQYFDVPPMGAAWEEDGNPDYGYRVDIMSQQSVISMSNTLAHELLHLWQFYRKIRAPKPYAEGFCNLGAFLYVATLSPEEGLVNLSKMMENRDAAYGVAFRRLKVLHDVYGFEAVCKAMLTYR